MKPPDIIGVTLKVVGIFEKLGIAYYIGGSLASSAFGVARSTLDVDIVADIKLHHVPLIEKYLRDEFYVDAETIKEAIKQQASFNIIHYETMFKVDIFVLKDRPFDKQAFLRRLGKSMSEVDASQSLFFSTPEDIILNKLEWYKMGGQVSERQWNDVLGVLKVQGAQLNMSYLQQWAEELEVSDLLKKSLDDAGLRP